MTIICGVSSASHFTQVILNVPQPYGFPMLLKIGNDTLITADFSSKGEYNDALQRWGRAACRRGWGQFGWHNISHSAGSVTKQIMGFFQICLGYLH